MKLKPNLVEASNYLGALFNPGELVCAGSIYDTRLEPVQAAKGREFVVINPMQGSRSDANVTAFRNILIESDTVPVHEQQRLARKLGLPFTTAVFSGGKSVHFIVSLVEPLSSRREYDAWTSRIFRALKQASFPVDASVRNPSRFTRMAGSVRADKQELQDLLELNGRVTRARLDYWLNEHGAPHVETPKAEERPARSGWQRTLSGATLNFLMTGGEPGRRHHAAVCAACDMRECGRSFDETAAAIAKALGMDEEDAQVLKVVRWAFSKTEQAG